MQNLNGGVYGDFVISYIAWRRENNGVYLFFSRIEKSRYIRYLNDEVISLETLKRRKIIFIYKRIQFVNHSLFTTVSGYRIYMGFCEEKYVNKFYIILFFTFIQFRKTHYVDAISSNFRNGRATVHPSRKRINSSACSGRNKGSKGGSPNPRRIESVSSSAAFYLAFSHRIINERPRAQDR